MRNGERVDRVFPDWLQVNINDAGEYIPNDLNLPPFLYERPEGSSGYFNDAPLTEIGTATCQIIGRSLKFSPLWPITRIYCSPALRSVQSASEIGKGLCESIEICVEPALFDVSEFSIKTNFVIFFQYLGWYDTMPRYKRKRNILE